MAHPTTVSRSRRDPGNARWLGLAVALALMALAVVVPGLLGWEVYSHAHPTDQDFPPLHATWDPKVGVGTAPAILLALLGWRYAASLSERLPWPRLLAAAYVVGLAWLLALAFVDGSSGVTRALGNPYEYLETARATSDVPAMLQEYVARIPYNAHDNWVTHVAGHPPGTLLFFVALDGLGLASDLGAGLVVTLLAATTPVAVLITLRTLGAEGTARSVAPFLVLGPAAVWMAVSADALFAAVAAWGVATLALGATRRHRGAWGWSALAGLLLGYGVLMSYGFPLMGLVALAVLFLARSWVPLPIAVATATLVVLTFAAGGFSWWEALPVLRERYYDGVAAQRPTAYWLWANLAALCFSAGPILGSGLAQAMVSRHRAGRAVLLLTGAAVGAVVLADLSGMSKGEVERIWLPFVPWLLVSTALLPQRWRSAGLALQLVAALLVQHLLYTSW